MAHPFFTNSNILHCVMAHCPEKATHTSRVSIFLESGREIPDASAGPAVPCLGFGRPEVTEAIVNQDRPGGLSKAIFVNSGSKATDAAIKLASQYWHERGLIPRKQSYLGNTIGALGVSGYDSRRAMYQPWMSHNVSFADPCFSYRLQGREESDGEYVKRLADQLEAETTRVGSDNVSAFIAETVSGTTLGYLPAVPGYFKTVREIRDKYDILLILDEIMSRMGKTGTMYAWEQEGISGPDIQTIGKALGGDFIPLSGVLLREQVFEALAAGSGGLAHGQTFQAHPVAYAAALKVQQIVRDEDPLGNFSQMGVVLERLLNTHIAPIDIVG
ncbi:hypothetical protein ACHAQD_007284 [Fusarium lateritium]